MGRSLLRCFGLFNRKPKVLSFLLHT